MDRRSPTWSRYTPVTVFFLVACSAETRVIEPRSLDNLFYLHNTTVNDGLAMNAEIGTGAAELTFDTTGQIVRWYSASDYPSGGHDVVLENGFYTFHMYFEQSPTSSGWWNDSYPYRQQITITNNDTTPLHANTIASFSVNTAQLITEDKLRPDGNDWRIAYWDGSRWAEIARRVEGGWNTTSTETWFRLRASIDPAAIDGGYYVYYGSADETTAPAELTNNEEELESYLTGDEQGNEALDYDQTEWGAAQGVQFDAGQSRYWKITRFSFFQNDRAGSSGEVAGFVFDATNSLEGDEIPNGKSNSVSSASFANSSLNDLIWSSPQPKVKAGQQYYLAILPTTPAGREASGNWFRWDYDNSDASYRNGYDQCKAFGINRAGAWGFFLVNDGADRVFRVYGREAANDELAVILGDEKINGLTIQATVSHTAPDGSSAATIVQSSNVVITQATISPYRLDIGKGSVQIFTVTDPRKIRIQLKVVGDNDQGLSLDYDSASKTSRLETPDLTPLAASKI